ncbi:MAG: hypothetical protein HRU38_11390 [Saccharospirillaceae bacterium]|nr:hypothetical protein [Pseudomonadales bacterium]NRB79255.1 hypothetical protein [Saccharospirillaceae bacterium]
MKIIIITLLTNLILISSAMAVDSTNSSYGAGSLVGKIFMGVLLFLIVKKYVFKK